MINPAFIPRQIIQQRIRPSRPERKRRSFSVLWGFAVFMSILIGLALLNAGVENETQNTGAEATVPAPEGQAQ